MWSWTAFFHMCFDDAFDSPITQYPEKSLQPWIKCARAGKLNDYLYTNTNYNQSQMCGNVPLIAI